MAAAQGALTDRANGRQDTAAARIKVFVARAGLRMAATSTLGNIASSIAHGLAAAGSEPGGKNICDAR